MYMTVESVYPNSNIFLLFFCLENLFIADGRILIFPTIIILLSTPLRCSVQFSPSVVSDSLWPHESQHARPPCPSQTPGVYSTHAHRVGDAIQPSYPLSSPSPPVLNPSQHQGLFQWVSSWHEVATVLEFQFQHQSFQRTPRADLL